MANSGFWVDGLAGTADRMNAALLQYTTIAAKEAAGQTGRLHYATDGSATTGIGQLSRDNGAGYDNINPVGAAKAHVTIPADGVTEVNVHNVASVTDTGVGDRTIVWDTDFADANYSCVSTVGEDVERFITHDTFAVGSVRLAIKTSTPALTDHLTGTVAFGDQ